ncbi:MAG: methylated-DNA--[protein]-cysteine S-methyltransferase [Rhodospirillaceae bacterium]|nr:methylated-DNA--[protein]-cysteine S-methyltransferase [Rhodospirillaceae bacterium]
MPDALLTSGSALLAPAQMDAVRRACAMIHAAEDSPPTLDTLAKAVGIGATQFQKLFKRATGVSPRQYAEMRRVAKVKALLRQGEPVASALYGAGYGSSRGLYETAHATLGMTPATYKKGGLGATIGYAFGRSALGLVLVAATARGVCFVALGDKQAPLVAELRAEFPAAEIVEDAGRLGTWLDEVLRRLEGAEPASTLPLDVRCTAFQRRVWQALTEIPLGETRTYSELAATLGAPRAQRAVGRACATNPVSILVPCHRAVREDGGLGGYRWGLTRKQAILKNEGAEAGGFPARRSGR